MGSKGFMRDSYVGGIGNASFIPDSTGYHPNQLVTQDEEPVTGNDVINRQPASMAWNTFEPVKAGNQTDEDKMIGLTCNDDVKVTNINKTEEYNVGYVGLSILPWEDFVFNPRAFNELFYLESNHRITYDPEEVNTFFHGKNVMPPSVGDISENGKSWNIVVDNLADLKRVRTWLTERCSVFGVNLLYKEKRFQKPERAPCLVMMDPNKGMIGDKIYTTITRAMDSLHNRRRFCVEININACVERWCKRVLMTDCEVVGGKLVITNGEEYLAMDGIEDKVCCVVCFPIWLLQTGIYKLHRTVVYDDFKMTFDADDLFLHGTFQDSRCQRRQIFTASHDQSVFRTRSAAQTDLRTLQDLGSFKFVSVKRYDKGDADETYDESISRVTEHNTTTFGELVQKRKDKVLNKEQKLSAKQKDKLGESNYDSEAEVKNAGINDDKSNGVMVYSQSKTMEETKAMVDKQIIRTEPEEEAIETDPSDNENETGLKIPEVASVLCDNDGDSYKEIHESKNNGNTDSLFSPGAHHELVCKESSIGAKASFNTNAVFSNRKGNIDNEVCMFDNNAFDDSDTETEESESEECVAEDLNDTGKDDLLNEMLQIEKTLPSIRKDSVFTSKDVQDLKIDEAKKGAKKKKRRDKPGVKKALKDLMKTTKAKKDTLPSAVDDRYQEAASKLKQEQVKTATINASPKPGKHDRQPVKSESPKSDQSDFTNVSIRSKMTQESIPIMAETRDDKVTLEGSTVDEVVSFIKDEDDDVEESAVLKKTDAFSTDAKRSPPDGAIANGPPMANAFDDTSDSSSTDGDDVEMIYQSSRDPPNSKGASLFLRNDNDIGAIEQVSSMNYMIDDADDVEDMCSFTTDNSTNKTDGEKSKRLNRPFAKQTKNLDRNTMFQKTNRANSGQKQKTKKSDDVDKPVKIPTVTKSLDIDMEVTDFDQEFDIPNESVVKSMDAMDNDLDLKLNLGKGKKQKRGVNRYNSNRKYLGASVPPKVKNK